MAFLTERYGAWYIKYKDSDGTWKYKSCGKQATKADAKVILTEYENFEFNNKNKKPIKKLNFSLGEVITRFRATLTEEGNKAKNSVERDLSTLDQFEAYVQANKLDFKTIKPKEYIKYRKETGHPYKEATGVKPATLLKDVRMVKKFFKWAQANHFITGNPAENIDLPKVTPKTPRYFSKDELKKIVDSSDGHYRDIYRFLANTGLRTGELANLRWTDWNADRNFLIIRVIDGDRSKRRTGNKTKIEGTIPLNSIAREILKKRKADPAAHPEFIFTNEGGNQLDNDNVFRNLKRILKKHNITEASPHTFRHTFASYLAMNGVSLFTIKELLRHKSIEQTQIYSHLSDEAKSSAVEKISLGRIEKTGPALKMDIDISKIEL